VQEEAVAKQGVVHQVERVELRDPSFKVVAALMRVVVVVDIMVAVVTTIAAPVQAAVDPLGLDFLQASLVQTVQIDIPRQGQAFQDI
jgi:hypothetical protein